MNGALKNRQWNPSSPHTITGTDMRDSGISVIGPMPWGTHLCQFYDTPQDLIDIFVPYFKTGLQHNERCIWITSDLVPVKDAIEALRKVVPRIDALLQEGQMEIRAHTDWYAQGGNFDGDRVLSGWRTKHDEALKAGYDGLRVAGDTFWLERDQWKDFAEYESAVHEVIDGAKMLAVCAYSLQKCVPTDIVDVIGSHRLVLIKRNARWEAIESSERKRAEEAMYMSENRYRSLFHNMLDAFAFHEIVLDESGRPTDYIFLEVNDAFERYTGLRRDTVIGKRATEVIPGIEKDPTDWIGRYGAVALTGKGTRFESYAEALDRWYDIAAYSSEKGYFTVTFTDVTKRKQAEKALKESREDLSHAQQVAHIGNWRLDVHKNELMWSRETYRMFGIPEGTPLTYEVFLSAVHPGDREVVNAAWQKALQGEPYDIEHRIRIGKETKWIRERAELEFDTQGTLSGGFGTAQDVTEQKSTEKALKESQADLTRAQAIAQVGSWRFRMSTGVFTWSDEMYKVYGISKDTPLQNDIFTAAIHPDDRALVDTAWATGLQSGKFDLGHRIIMPEGSIKWIHQRAELKADTEGSLAEGFGTVQDVTEQKRAEENQSRFLAILGHELRNPLAPITLALELLKDKPIEDPDIQEAIAVVGRQTKNIAALLDDLLDISRIANGKVELQEKKIYLHDTVKRAIETINPLIRRNEQTVHVSLPNRSVSFVADRLRIEQILVNLLSNASKYSDRRSDISLMGAVQGNEVVIEVKDDGIGIPRGASEHVFEFLMRTDDDRSRRRDGLGVGLYISRELAHLHGGDITVASDGLGKGCTFTLHIPCNKEAVAGSTSPLPLPVQPPVPSTGRKVLIVDDNRNLANMIGKAVRLLNGEEEVCYDGKTAVAAAHRMKPDIALIDIGMPGMDGFEVVRRMRADKDLSHTLFVAITGYGQERDRENARNAGFDQFLIKPISVDNLSKLLTDMESA